MWGRWGALPSLCVGRKGRCAQKAAACAVGGDSYVLAVYGGIWNEESVLWDMSEEARRESVAHTPRQGVCDAHVSVSLELCDRGVCKASPSVVGFSSRKAKAQQAQSVRICIHQGREHGFREQGSLLVSGRDRERCREGRQRHG